MVSLKSLLLIVCLLLSSAASANANKLPYAGGDYSLKKELDDGRQYGYGLHLPRGMSEFTDIPLVVALHFGHPGPGPVPLDIGYQFMKRLMSEAFPQAVIIAPSALERAWHHEDNTEQLFKLMDEIKSAYDIDEQRILLTGYSLGGMGAWSVGAEHESEFSAIMPIAGVPKYWVEPDQQTFSQESPKPRLETLPDVIKTDWSIPVYTINSKADVNVPISIVDNYRKFLDAQGGNSNVHFITLEEPEHFDFPQFMHVAKKAYLRIQENWNVVVDSSK